METPKMAAPTTSFVERKNPLPASEMFGHDGKYGLQQEDPGQPPDGLQLIWDTVMATTVSVGEYCDNADHKKFGAINERVSQIAYCYKDCEYGRMRVIYRGPK
jgi:hypothetical protein